MKTIVVCLLVASALVAVHAQASVPLGSSCLSFNSTVCVGQLDGATFDNIADCGSPFCHETYIVCMAQRPVTMRCANETVWNNLNQTCINRPDGPGGCPALCGEYDPMACQSQPDGTRLNNPLDCQAGGLPTSFLYCLNEVPIVTECPDDSYWSSAVNSCIDIAGLPVLNAPEIPGMDDLPLLPAELPAAPTPAPAVRRNRRVSRTRPVLAPGQTYTVFNFYIQGKDLTEVTDSIIEAAVANSTGANILAIEQLTYIVRLGLVMRDFNLPMNTATMSGLEDAYKALIALAYPGVLPREVVISNVQGGVSTASFDTTSQSVTAVADIYNREELQTAIEVLESLPSFDEVMSEALALISNNTAERLGVTNDLAAYINSELTTLSDYSMIVNVTLLHTLGRTGNQLLASAVENGDMAQALSTELGQDVVSVLSISDSVEVPKPVYAQAPAPGVVVPVQATPVTPSNSAVSQSFSGVIMALIGAACLSAFML